MAVARPGGLPHPAGDDAAGSRRPATAGDAAASATAFRITLRSAGRRSAPSRRGPARSRPPVAGALDADAGRRTRRHDAAFVFTPPSAARARHDVPIALAALRRRRRRAVDASSRTSRVDDRRAADASSGSGRSTARTNVERRAALSVRFSEPMDQRTTRRPHSRVTADGKAVAGKVSLRRERHASSSSSRPSRCRTAPRSTMHRRTATATLGDRRRRSARRRPGDDHDGRKPTAVTTAPAARSTADPPIRRRERRRRRVGGGSWGAVETYYLRLMNCTRTGGWVTSSGSVQQPRRPERRPAQARRRDLVEGLAARTPRSSRSATCAPTSSAATRATGSAAAGYTSYIWAENLGCRSGNPTSAVLGSHLYFQSEKSYNGGHYVNLMNAKYDRGRDRRLGLGRPGPPRHRLLPPALTRSAPEPSRRATGSPSGRDHRAGDGLPATRDDRGHDPQRRHPHRATSSRCWPTSTRCRPPTDVSLVCTNVRMLDGKKPRVHRPQRVVFFFPYLHIRFIEILPRRRDRPARPAERRRDAADAVEPAEADETRGRLELDEDFLRRIRDV